MSKIIPTIKVDTKIAIIAHVNPDGDSLGSILALGLALLKKSNQVNIFLNDELPGRYQFLPGVNLLKKYDTNKYEGFDLVFVLDCGDDSRFGDIDILEKSTKVINIDHHVSNNSYGDINFVRVDASSTCEIVFSIITEELEIQLHKQIATCLYTGIVTDTGNFRYESTTSYTHEVAAKLLDLGVNIQEITFYLFQNNSLKSLKFLGHMLNCLELFHDGKVAFMMVDQNLLSKFHVKHDEIEGIINYARDIEGVEVAVVLKEASNGDIKLSFRSKTDYDVNVLAKEFGGGGHRRASGATLTGDMLKVKEEILEKLQKII